MTQLVFVTLIHWVVIYTVNSAIQRLNNRGLLVFFSVRIRWAVWSRENLGRPITLILTSWNLYILFDPMFYFV